MPIREFLDDSVDPHIRGFLHLPDQPTGDALVLTHGAGSNAKAPLLVALAATFSAAGFTVLRCDLPYRQSRSYGPPGPGDAARDRAGLKNAIAALRNIKPHEGGPPHAVVVGWNRILLAGHSYGGRQSSILCSEEPGLVSGLLLLSYPLHPRRRPEQERTAHLPNLRTPALFVHGTRDPFGSIAEIEHALKMIPAHAKLLAVESAGHDLGFKGKATQQDLPAKILAAFRALLDLPASESAPSNRSGLPR